MADVKISGMTPGTALTGAELFESVQTAATVSLTAPQIKAYSNQSGYTYNVPITGFSLTIGAAIQVLVLNPAGVLATGTVILPVAPLDGDQVRISTTQTITALTLTPSGTQTIANAVTTLAGDGFVAYLYSTAQNKWFRVG